MAVEPGEEPKGDEGETDVLELTEADKAPDDQQDEDEPKQPEGGEDEEVLVSFGGEPAPGSDGDAPEWVRDLRKKYRELERENAELKSKAAPKAPEAGPKPELYDEGIDGDEATYDAAIIAWHERKRAAEAAKTEAQKAEEQAQERWHAELGTYATQKDKLGVKDFNTAEEEVLSALTPQQQAILVQGAESKALLVYALGKSPDKLRELAAIQDPIKFAFAAAKLEGKTKMERRPATAPESRVTGSAPLSGSSDKQLQRLEKEAEATGNRTALIAYKKSKGLL